MSDFRMQVETIYPSRSWTYSDGEHDPVNVAVWTLYAGVTVVVVRDTRKEFPWSVGSSFPEVGAKGFSLEAAAEEFHNKFEEISRLTHALRPCLKKINA